MKTKQNIDGKLLSFARGINTSFTTCAHRPAQGRKYRLMTRAKANKLIRENYPINEAIIREEFQRVVANLRTPQP